MVLSHVSSLCHLRGCDLGPSFDGTSWGCSLEACPNTFDVDDLEDVD